MVQSTSESIKFKVLEDRLKAELAPRDLENNLILIDAITDGAYIYIYDNTEQNVKNKLKKIKIDDVTESVRKTIEKKIDEFALRFKIVTSLPTPAKVEKNVVYLLRVANPSAEVDKDGFNNYDEYLWVNNDWERFGSAKIDLSAYRKAADQDVIDNQLKARVTHLEANYIDKSKIADNTTTDDGSKVLSARQGKNLNSAINSEINRASLEETNIKTTISNEVTRATNKEALLETAISDEARAREAADVDLQQQIDALTSKSDVVDVVATKAALEAYDTTGLNDKDIIKVLADESIEGHPTAYYRWRILLGGENHWEFIGSIESYYTVGETDALLAQKQDVLIGKLGVVGQNIKTINGYSILGSGNIETAEGARGPQGPRGKIYTTTSTAQPSWENVWVYYSDIINYHPEDGDVIAIGDVVLFSNAVYAFVKEAMPTYVVLDVIHTLSGPVGPTGATGATGAQGDIGPTGAKGDIGAIGPTGDIGPTGARGAVGPTGEIGPTGAALTYEDLTPEQKAELVGPTGATGNIGPTGLTGAIGPTGPQGPIGPAGKNAKQYSTTDTTVEGYENVWVYFANIINYDTSIAVGDVIVFSNANYGIISSIAEDHVVISIAISMRGPTGPQGPQGIQGPTGDTGIQGPTGISIISVTKVGTADLIDTYRITFSNDSTFDYTVTNGAAGNVGPIGPTGQTGATGTTPHIGANGTWWIGSTDTGVKAQGPAGSNGAKGDTGPTGPTGDAGADGKEGPTGPQGLVGPTGATGIQGPTGPTGESGKVGPTGPTGPQGIEGKEGPTGAKGDAGEAGPTGPTGSVGPQGEIGPTGAKGDKGDAGPIGPTGIQGDLGPTGPQGIQGPTGAPGLTTSIKLGEAGSTYTQVNGLITLPAYPDISGKQNISSLEADVLALHFTQNAVTEILMNNQTVSVINGIANLGTVITAHQDLSSKQDKIDATHKLSYTLLSDTPTIPEAPVQADWNETDSSELSYIKNKPTIPAAQIQSDWNQSDNTKLDYIKNKPTIPVTDVQVNGVSVVTSTVANVDLSSKQNNLTTSSVTSGTPTSVIGFDSQGGLVRGEFAVNPVQDLTSVDLFTVVSSDWETLKTTHYKVIENVVLTGLDSTKEFVNTSCTINAATHNFKLNKNTTNKYTGLFFVPDSTHLYELAIYFDAATNTVVVRSATIY